MKTSATGIELIKSFEGCRLKAYKAVSWEKYYTIGYGHYGADVRSDMTITQAEATSMLASDLNAYEKLVESNCRKLDLTQQEFDALVSFTYNCGVANLKKLINGRTKPVIAEKILLYNKSGGKVLKGLQRRRAAERKMFLTGDWK